MNLNNAPYKFPKRNAEIHMNQNLLWSIQSFIFPANIFIAFDLVIKTVIFRTLNIILYLFKKFTLNMVMNTLRLVGSLFRLLFNVFLLKID